MNIGCKEPIMKIPFCSYICLLWLVGCSSNTGVTQKEKNQAFRDYLQSEKIHSVKRITAFRFHGWSSLTDDFLLISSSRKRKYLLELSGFCNDMRWVHSIFINRSTSSTLQAKFDSISTVKNPEVKCFIKTIYPLTPEQKANIKAINNPTETATEEPTAKGEAKLKVKAKIEKPAEKT